MIHTSPCWDLYAHVLTYKAALFDVAFYYSKCLQKAVEPRVLICEACKRQSAITLTPVAKKAY
jgi:hypothetical protein